MEEQQVIIKKDLPGVEAKSDTRLLSLIVGALAVLIILAIIGIVVGVNLLLKNRSNTPAPTPIVQTPTPTPTPMQNFKYASNSGVIKLKDDLNKLGSQIDSTDYFETEILPPSLDSKIKIE